MGDFAASLGYEKLEIADHQMPPEKRTNFEIPYGISKIVLFFGSHLVICNII